MDRSQPKTSTGRRSIAGVLVSALVIAGGIFWWKSAQPTGIDSRTGTTVAKPVKIGIQMSPAMAVVMVAQDGGFFRRHGVESSLEPFTAGKFALQAQLAGSIDFSVSGEVPTCLAVMQGNKLRVVGQVVERTVNEVRVVALKDGDITDPAAYFKKKKRKLSTSFGGGPEMYTYTFLKHFGIGADEVEVISQKPEDMPAALESRSVDAIAVFDPFAFIAEKRLGSKAQTFTDPALYSELYVLNASPEQVQQESETIEKILRALVAAGEFTESHPGEAKDIVERYTKLDREVIDGIWGNFVFKPALTRQLIDTWKAEAEWAKATDKVPSKAEIPDFRQSVIVDSFLKKVAPESVLVD